MLKVPTEVKVYVGSIQIALKTAMAADPGGGSDLRRLHPLNIFVSSPADCAEERRRLAAVIDRLSTSELTRSQKLALRPLLWENLPPGPGKPGDAQKRISDLLKQYGLRRYEVYIGFMKCRTGTPTPRAPSGTIDEFQDAIASRRQHGRPAEVMVYFLADEAPEPGVREFRAELEQAGFIYHTADSGEAFEQLCEAHLRVIIAEWWKFRKRLRRATQQIRLAGWLLLALAAIYYVSFDLGGSRAILRTARVQPMDALTAWDHDAPYLVLHKAYVRRRVNEEIIRDITSTPNLEDALQKYTRWSSHPAHEDAAVRTAAAGLIKRSTEAIGAAVRGDEEASALILWSNAERAGIWTAQSPERLRALRQVAGQRLFLSLLRGRKDITSVGELRLQDGELRTMTEFSASITADPAAFAHWGTWRHRLLAVLLTERWPMLEEEASRALSDTGEAEDALLTNFVLHAPVPQLAAWLEQNIKPDLPGYLFQAVVDGASRRHDTTVAFILADLIATGRTPYDPFATDSRSFFDLPPQDPGARQEAFDRAARWVTGQKLPPVDLFSVLLPLIPVENLDAVQREKWSVFFVYLAESSSLDATALPNLLALISRLSSPAGNAYLEKQLELHLHDKIYLGLGQRTALLGHLQHGPIRDPVGKALRLAEITHAQVAHQASQRYGAPDDGKVQAEYIRTLALLGATSWTPHLTFIRGLVQDRSRITDSIYTADFNGALAVLLAVLPEPALRELLALPDPRSPVFDMVSAHERWPYLFGLLDQSEREWSPGFCRDVATAFAATRVHEPSLLQALARRGGAGIVEQLRPALDEAGPDFLIYLAFAGKHRDAAQALAAENPARREKRLEDFLTGTEGMPEDARRSLLTALAAAFAEDAVANRRLLPVAGRLRMRLPGCIAAATALVRDRSVRFGELGAALNYLGQFEPKRLGAAFEDGSLAKRLDDLQRGDPAEWLMVMQDIEWEAPSEPPPALCHLLQRGNANYLLVLENRQIKPADGMQIGTYGVNNPVVELLVEKSPRQVWPTLLELAAKAPANMRTIGVMQDAANVFRTYCLWRAATALDKDRPAPPPELPHFRFLVEALADGDPNRARAAAAVILAGVPE